MDIGAIEVLKEPIFDKFKANYGVKLIRPNSNAQFGFTLKNDGNIDAKITDIKITGIESYKNFVDISFVNLAVGDDYVLFSSLNKTGREEILKILENFIIETI